MNTMTIENDEYEEVLSQELLNTFIKEYEDDIVILFDKLQKEYIIQEFVLTYACNLFTVNINSTYSSDFILKKLYQLIVDASTPGSYKFMYHHPTEVLETIKLTPIKST